MTDITLKQRARQVIADWHREKGCSQQVIDDCLSGNITIPEFYMELLEAALRLSAGADWVLVPREPTAHMVNRAHDATDPDCNATCGEIVEIYRAMLAAAPRHEPGEGL